MQKLIQFPILRRCKSCRQFGQKLPPPYNSGNSLSDAYTAALKKEGGNGVLPKTLPTRNMKRQINEETETSIQWTGKKIVNVCVNSEGFDCFELKQQKDHVDVTFTVATP